MLPSFLHDFSRLCDAACARGWHEANGGNLSYLLADEDVVSLDAWSQEEAVLQDARARGDADAGIWHELSAPVPGLAGARILLTASGSHLRNLSHDLSTNAGVIELDDAGRAWRVVWGFAKGGRPSSELETHLAVYARAAQSFDDGSIPQVRVVYHAHCPHVIALSTVIPSSSYAWTRTLWRCMTEGIIVFPQGIAALPWMVPGSPELAEETGKALAAVPACVWAQHGLMARAAGFDEAFGLVETIEKSAGVYLEARAASGGDEPAYLVDDEQLRAICARYGLHPNEEFLQ